MSKRPGESGLEAILPGSVPSNVLKNRLHDVAATAAATTLLPGWILSSPCFFAS